jgi:hypothetical protein
MRPRHKKCPAREGRANKPSAHLRRHASKKCPAREGRAMKGFPMARRKRFRFHPQPQLLDRSRAQIDTVTIPFEDIVGAEAFAIGVDERRRGAPPRFDIPRTNTDAVWWYEKGRQFGVVAPAGMPLRVNGKLNKEAVRLYAHFVQKGFIAP